MAQACKPVGSAKPCVGELAAGLTIVLVLAGVVVSRSGRIAATEAAFTDLAVPPRSLGAPDGAVAPSLHAGAVDETGASEPGRGGSDGRSGDHSE